MLSNIILEHVDGGDYWPKEPPRELFNRPGSPPNTCLFKTHTQMRIAIDYTRNDTAERTAYTPDAKHPKAFNAAAG